LGNSARHSPRLLSHKTIELLELMLLKYTLMPYRADSEIVAGMHKYTDWREYRRALDNYELRQEERSLAFENNEITLEEYQLLSASDQKPTYIGKK
jgi:hypothetical protein